MLPIHLCVAGGKPAGSLIDYVVFVWSFSIVQSHRDDNIHSGCQYIATHQGCTMNSIHTLHLGSIAMCSLRGTIITYKFCIVIFFLGRAPSSALSTNEQGLIGSRTDGSKIPAFHCKTQIWLSISYPSSHETIHALPF